MSHIGNRLGAGCCGLQVWRAAILLGLALLIQGMNAQAASLTAIHDYRYLVSGLPPPERDYPSLVHEFEGLAFTDNGDLWASIAADPFGTRREFWKLDLRASRVERSVLDTFFEPTALFANPVALGAAGSQLIVGENRAALRARGVPVNDVIWAFTPGNAASSPSNPDWSFSLNPSVCDEVEGAAAAGGKIYVTCQSDRRILEIQRQSGQIQIDRQIPLGGDLLGLEAIDDAHLIVGDYTHHKLLLLDLTQGAVTDSIDLRSLFYGRNSDYFRLTGQEYSVQVVPSEGFRKMPDPDGLAYRGGRIYMAFDGDLRIFEISLNVPEPGTLALLCAGLLGLGWGRGRLNSGGRSADDGSQAC